MIIIIIIILRNNHTHKVRKKGSNIKGHHNSTQKPW